MPECVRGSNDVIVGVDVVVVVVVGGVGVGIGIVGVGVDVSTATRCKLKESQIRRRETLMEWKERERVWKVEKGVRQQYERKGERENRRK